MREALNKKRGRTSNPQGHFGQVANDALLSSPAGSALYARLSGATIEQEFYAGRDEHIRAVAFVAMQAKGMA